MVKYCREPAEPTKCKPLISCLISYVAAKSRVDDLRAHYKNTYETANSVKGLKLKKAIRYMEDVIEHKQCVPFLKHTGCIGRTA